MYKIKECIKTCNLVANNFCCFCAAAVSEDDTICEIMTWPGSGLCLFRNSRSGNRLLEVRCCVFQTKRQYAEDRNANYVTMKFFEWNWLYSMCGTPWHDRFNGGRVVCFIQFFFFLKICRRCGCCWAFFWALRGKIGANELELESQQLFTWQLI